MLELFQWKTPEEVKETQLERIKEELADVLIYSYMMADNLHLDLDEIIEEKLIKNNLKYPVEKAQVYEKNTQSCRNVSFGCWKEQKKNSKMSLEGEKMKKKEKQKDG